MNFTIRSLNCFAALLVLAAFSASGINGQNRDTTGVKFTDVQEVYAACGQKDHDEKRGAAILVRRISESAVDVFIAVGSTKRWESEEEFGKLEFFVQPLKLVGNSSTGDIYFETGQSAALSSAAGISPDDEKEIIIAPKITMPVPRDASAITVKVNALYGTDSVSVLTAKIDRQNTAKTCFLRKYPPKK
ncbi:MAG: hypothetical protein KDB79_07270 [Acidobacteria bacterium]|nr:hypothetical protein [Acidobacteriota bacterium]